MYIQDVKKTILFVFLLISSSFLFAQEKNLISRTNIQKDDVSELELNLSFESISTKRIYGDEISIEIYSNNNTKLPEISCKNGVLKIETKAKKGNAGEICSVVLYIPDRFIFEDIEIKTQTGDIELQNVRVQQEINISFEKASVSLENIKAEFLGIKGIEGKFLAQKINTEYFKIYTEKANISLSLSSKIIAQSNITSYSGDITIYTPALGKDDPKIHVSTKKGKVTYR